MNNRFSLHLFNILFANLNDVELYNETKYPLNETYWFTSIILLYKQNRQHRKNLLVLLSHKLIQIYTK